MLLRDLVPNHRFIVEGTEYKYTKLPLSHSVSEMLRTEKGQKVLVLSDLTNQVTWFWDTTEVLDIGR